MGTRRTRKGGSVSHPDGEPPAQAGTAIRAAWAALPSDETSARRALWQALDEAERLGDGAAAALAAAGLLVAIAIEFADFRGLARAQAAFLRDGAALPASADDGAVLDLARLTLPLLDGGQPFDDSCTAAAERVRRRLTEDAAAADADARMMVLKLLLDYHGQQLDLGQIEQLIALGHELAAMPGVSPVWQGRWWLLVLQNREWFGDTVGASQALQQAQRLVQQHMLPRLRFELACVEMSAAVKVADMALADRLFRELDALRPAIRPGRLPHGLRAQALYLAARGEVAAALQRLDLLLALCAEMEVPARDVGPYHVLRADCLLALGRHSEGIEVLQAEARGQQGPQLKLFEARIAVHRAAGAIDDTREAADVLCRQALQACADLRYSRFLRPLPQLAARLVERGLRLGVAAEFLRDVVHERRLVPADPSRDDWPWPLRVCALGPLQMWRAGVPLASSGSGRAQRKPLELLRLLAAHAGGPLAVSLVVDELWPSLDLDAPRASFDMAVSRLRKLLHMHDAVRVADDTVSLDPARVWVDVAAFEALAARAVREPPSSGDGAARAALALYRAPLFGSEPLRGLMHTARGRLAMAHELLVQAQAERLLSQGLGPQALHSVRQALLQDPLNEPLHRTLMQAHLQMGERGEVLRAYRRLQALLAAQFGLQPSDQTTAIARAAGL